MLGSSNTLWIFEMSNGEEGLSSELGLPLALPVATFRAEKKRVGL